MHKDLKGFLDCTYFVFHSSRMTKVDDEPLEKKKLANVCKSSYFFAKRRLPFFLLEKEENEMEERKVDDQKKKRRKKFLLVSHPYS